MRRPVLALGLVLLLAACRGSSLAPVEQPITKESGVEGGLADSGTQRPTFDLDAFEPPFGRLPLREAFVRAHGLRRVVLHEDAITEDARIVDVEVTTFDYDREGRLLARSTRSYGEPGEEIRYEHADGRLATETHVLPDGTRSVIRYHHDAAGRVERIERELPRGTIEEQHAYDEQGRPSRITRIEAGQRSEQSFTYAGESLRRVVLRLPDGSEVTTEHAYDTDGRPTRRVQRGSTGDADTYEFTWDERGRLRAQSFDEGEKKIYRRTYAYDEDGRPLREELQSFVPAMGNGSVIRYEYERHDELPRQAAVAGAAAGREPSTHGNAELLAATVKAFPGAYAELAVVAHETIGKGRFNPTTVTVYVPEAIVRLRSEAELQQQACEAKKALGWSCDCERVTLGEPVDHAWHSWADKRVVPLTLHLGLGC